MKMRGRRILKINALRAILLLLLVIGSNTTVNAREATYWSTTSTYFPYLGQSTLITGSSPQLAADEACRIVEAFRGRLNIPSSFDGLSNGACVRVSGTFYTVDHTVGSGTFRTECRAYCAYRNGGGNDSSSTGGHHSVIPITIDCSNVISGVNSVHDEVCALPDEPKKDHGCAGANGVGNPCNVATGNKYQSETDFSSQGVSFTRSYNSRNLTDLGLGKGWRSNYQKKLIVGTDGLIQVSSTGRGESWVKATGVWQGDADSDVIITQNAAGFKLVRSSGAIENYTPEGQLISEIDTNGHETAYGYNLDEQLSQVTTNTDTLLILAILMVI